MGNSITVYYFSTHPYSDLDLKNGYFREMLSPVESVNKEYAIKEKNNQYPLIKCPAFREHFKNTFSIKSNYDYKFQITKDKLIYSEDYDEKFFNDTFVLRNMTENLVSLKFNYFHMIPDESVLVSQIHPTLGKGDLVKKSNIVPGSFNAYLHPRSVESAFWLNDNNYDIKRGDDLFYLKFHTDKKINFKRIHPHRDIINLMTNFITHRNYSRSVFSLDYWYDFSSKTKINKRLLDIIKKKNLIIK